MCESKDQTARRAAELIRDGLAGTIPEAIDQACRQPGRLPGPPPGPAQVRRHLEGMRMSQQGWTQWHAQRVERLRDLEQLLASLEYFFDDLELRVTGRPARGQIDPGGTVHIRLWIDGTLGELASMLETTGSGIPEISSRPVKRGLAKGTARLGVLDLSLECIDVRISVCPEKSVVRESANLVTGQPIELATPDDIRRLIDETCGDSDYAD